MERRPYEVQQYRDRVEKKLDLINELLQSAALAAILERVNRMNVELDRLTASIAGMKTVGQSSNALLRKLAQMIRDNANDPAALTALADDVDAQSADMSAAVVENTPAEGEPPVEEPPVEEPPVDPNA